MAEPNTKMAEHTRKSKPKFQPIFNRLPLKRKADEDFMNGLIPQGH